MKQIGHFIIFADLNRIVHHYHTILIFKCRNIFDPGMIDVHSVEEYYSLLSAASIDYLKIMTQNRYLAEFVCVEKYVVIF